MKKVIKRLLIILFISLLAICCKSGTVKASDTFSGNWENTYFSNSSTTLTIAAYTSSYNTITMSGSRGLFCVWHGGSCAAWVKNTYLAKYKLEIVGSDVTVYKANSGSWSQTTTSSSTDIAYLAYCLASTETSKRNISK